MGTHASKHQIDPVQRGQQKENKRQKETEVIGLSHTAVDPTTNQTNKTPNWDLEIHLHISVTQSKMKAEGEINSLSLLHTFTWRTNYFTVALDTKSLIDAY